MSSCLVELLPVEAWLLVLAGYSGDPPDQAAAPLWYLGVIMAAAWALGSRLRGRADSRVWLVSLPCFLCLYLVLIRISPAGFGDDGAHPFDFSWLGAPVSPATSRTLPGALVMLLVLFAFLWWRATALATGSRASEDALRRFGIYMGVLMLAVLGLNAVHPDLRDPYSAAMTLIVIGEVICGLVSAALMRLESQRREHDTGMREGNDAQWIGSAVLVALVVIVVALIVSLIFSFQSFLALLGYLGPIGAAIGMGLTWLENLLADGLTRLMRLLTAPFSQSRAPAAPAPRLTFQCTTVKVNGKTQVRCGQMPNMPTASNITRIEVLVFLAIILVVTAVIFYVAIHHALNRQRELSEPDAADEREALDARGMFAEQMRGLLDRFRRHEDEEPDPLQPGTVRYMYRQVLRSARSHNRERAPSETPDEYAKRLSSGVPFAAYSNGETDDLLALSEAYDGARYAGREPDAPTRAALQDRTRRLTRLLRE